jgi:fluoroquinolone transport system permease protein
MRDLLALLRWDLRMQYRYGFWTAGLVVTLMWVVLLRPLSPGYREIWLPCLLYLDIGALGLMFVAGVLFFERRQGVLDALVVTPLRTSAWLASKVLSLTFLATAAACVLVLLTAGVDVAWPRLVPSFALVAALYTLLGFLLAARFGSVSSFLVAFSLVGVPFALPLLDYFDIWRHPVLWVNPAQPTAVLIWRSFRPGIGLEFATAVALTGFWLALAFRLSVRAFHRQVGWRRGAA